MLLLKEENEVIGQHCIEQCIQCILLAIAMVSLVLHVIVIGTLRCLVGEEWIRGSGCDAIDTQAAG